MLCLDHFLFPLLSSSSRVCLYRIVKVNYTQSQLFMCLFFASISPIKYNYFTTTKNSNFLQYSYMFKQAGAACICLKFVQYKFHFYRYLHSCVLLNISCIEIIIFTLLCIVHYFYIFVLLTLHRQAYSYTGNSALRGTNIQLDLRQCAFILNGVCLCPSASQCRFLFCLLFF